MATFNVQINSDPNKDGLYSVFIRVTENRKHKKIKLSFRVPIDHFNKAAKYGKWIRMANHSYQKHNREIEDQLAKIKKKYEDLENANVAALDNIKKEQLAPTQMTLKKYFDGYLVNLEADSAIGYYNSVASKVNRFVTYFKGETMPIRSITPAHIAEYKKYLLDTKVKGVTVNDNLMRIHTVFKVALGDDTIVQDPFRAHIRAKVQPTHIKKLSDDEIAEMEKLNLPTTGEVNWMYHTRNYYLFSYYNAGIRVADLMQLRHSNISATWRLEYEMDKTGHGKSIQLNAKAMEILMLYYNPDADPTEYLFPILNSKEEYAQAVTYTEKRKMSLTLRRKLHNEISSKTTLINKNLGFISTKLKLSESISFHTSRHSFADKARRTMKKSKKVTIVDVMNMLGHKKISTTQGYMNSMDKESLDEAMEDIFN